MKELLTWYEEGYGYYPVEELTYDENYFNYYKGLEETPIGKKINQFRLDIVNTFTGGEVLDIGVGSGKFVSRPDTFGYDVNKYAEAWLKERGKWFNPYEQIPSRFKAVTFFDSLEHIKKPHILLDRLINCYVIVSIPIFRDKEHALASKHFKPHEHYWYFTEDGFKWWMGKAGFRFVMQSTMEEWCGREDIKTFVFYKEQYEA